MKPFYEKNQGLVDNCKALASAKGYGIAVYRSTTAHFDGHVRYAVHTTPNNRPFGTRSSAVETYWEARFAKYYRPSLRNERQCLKEMQQWLLEVPRRETKTVSV